MNKFKFGVWFLLILMSLWLAGLSNTWADEIVCSFTEPYLDFKYDSETATLTTSGLGMETRVFEGVGLAVTGVNDLRLAWADGTQRRLDLTIDYQGSDLMSDHVFPYSARYYASEQAHKPLHGGCSSDHLKMIIPIDEES